MYEVYLGIDVGSVSTNVVAVTKTMIYYTQLYKNQRPALGSGQRGLDELKMGDQIEVKAVGTTGSGRQLAGAMVGADIVKNEITAHATATVNFVPGVQTIFEIGGQDSKIIIIRDGMIVDFAMNTVCAAGTGSFLEHQSQRLGIPIKSSAKWPLKQKTSAYSGRCTVFRIRHDIKQQFGFSQPR